MQQRHTRLSGVDDIQPRAPRVGKLKIGETKETVKNGRTITYPSKLDYIIAKDGGGNRIASFHEVYGEKPTEFMAVLPSNDMRDFYWEAYRRYGSGTGLACHGDGRCAIVEATGETIECPCPYSEPTIRDDKEYPPACKVVASLSLWLYEVPELGIFQIDTGGYRSVSNIKWFLTVGLPALSGGQLAGIPIRVYVEPFQAMHDGKASVAYQWKLGLAHNMKPADVRVAAQKAVEGFCLPEDIGPRLIDEAKPEDLYAGEVVGDGTGEPLPALPEECYPPEAEPIVPGYPPEVIAAEMELDKAMHDANLPPAKVKSTQTAMKMHRDEASETGNWSGYCDWLLTATERAKAVAA